MGDEWPTDPLGLSFASLRGQVGGCRVGVDRTCVWRAILSENWRFMVRWEKWSWLGGGGSVGYEGSMGVGSAGRSGGCLGVNRLLRGTVLFSLSLSL